MPDNVLRKYIYLALLDAGLLFNHTSMAFIINNGFVPCRTFIKDEIVNALNRYRISMFCNFKNDNFNFFEEGIYFNIENISA